jgi:hypothetical protein
MNEHYRGGSQVTDFECLDAAGAANVQLHAQHNTRDH